MSRPKNSSRNDTIGRKNSFTEKFTHLDLWSLTRIRKIDQILQGRRPSSLARKSNTPTYTYILDLVLCDPVTDMPTSMRRGLANNIRFLIMRDMNATTGNPGLIPDNILLQYQYDKIAIWHRVIIQITGFELAHGLANYGEEWAITGKWVVDRVQALEGLRRRVDQIVYQDTVGNGKT